MSVRQAAPYFVSYAQLDTKLVRDLLNRLIPHLAASRRYAFEKWQDTDLLVGEDWHAEIVAALERHKIALLMVTPTFLVRPYILVEELPRLLVPEKIVLPVLTKPIDLARQDGRGLEALQLFAIRVTEGRRAYSECDPRQRDRFALELYQAIENRLARNL